MSDRKMGPREAQLFAMREAKYLRGQALNKSAKPAPKKATKPTVKKRKK